MCTDTETDELRNHYSFVWHFTSVPSFSLHKGTSAFASRYQTLLFYAHYCLQNGIPQHMFSSKDLYKAWKALRRRLYLDFLTRRRRKKLGFYTCNIIVNPYVLISSMTSSCVLFFVMFGSYW